nr:ribonuclease H-like domain-containing protein [Tanacetum cinerariifolium]
MLPSSRVTTVEKLLLLEEFMLIELRLRTYQRRDKDCLKNKNTSEDKYEEDIVDFAYSLIYTQSFHHCYFGFIQEETTKEELFTQKEEIELKCTQTSTASKLPILKQGNYVMWRLRIEQYFQVQDYALWDVIENGNSFKPVAQTTTIDAGTSTTHILGPITTEKKAQKKNDVKARSMLLMALPNEHLMTFNQYKDAKTLLQKIVSQLAVLGVFILQEDLNLKFLRSLPTEWNTHVMVWRNKSDLDTMSIDDLYNNFKIVKQEVKGTTSIHSSFQNMAFMSSLSPHSTNEVPTAYGVSTTSTQVSTANLSDATVSYMAEDEVHTNIDLMAFPDSEDRVSDNKDCSVESPVVVEKKTVVPTDTKIEFVKAKPKEKLVRKPVKPRPINTARLRPVNNARPNSTVVNVVQGNEKNVVKSSACWIWRPTGNVIDHISKDSGSYMLQRFIYFDHQGRLKSVKTVNEDVRLQALVDGKNVIINEAFIRRDLRLDDAEGTACLSNAVIFEELARMGVLSLEQNKTNQAAKIKKLKKKVKKLEGKKKKKRTHGLKILHKFGLSARFISSNEEGLGDQEDASKQGRKAKIDADEDLSLINETAQDHGRMNDQDMFGVNDLDGDEVVVDVSAGEKEEQSEKVAKKDVALPTTTTIDDELTLAQTLIEIKAAKPKAITTAATTVTAVSTRPKEKGIIMQEPSETPSPKPISSSQPSQLPQAKDKGKGITVELEKPLKKKDQIALDEKVARKLEARIKAEMEEKERIARKKYEENIVVIEEWDNAQATIDVDRQLAEQLQTQEREQLSIKERSKLLARRKYFTAKRAKEISNKPPTKAQWKIITCTYMKNMEGYKQKDFKGKSFDAIKKIVGDEIEQESAKRQRLEKEDDTGELKRCLKIVLKDDADVTIEATPLSSKSPTIFDYKIYKEGKKSYSKIIRADGNSQNYITFETMFKNFNIEHLEVLRSIVKERFKKTTLVDDMENLLF